MGMTRKFLSTCTFGGIDFLSDKERVARSARLTKQATRKSGKQNAQLLREQNNAIQYQNGMITGRPTVAGWYPDPDGGPGERWWTGKKWVYRRP